MRRRAPLAALLTTAAPLAILAASAGEARAQSGGEQPGLGVPAGASGAVSVPPKEEAAPAKAPVLVPPAVVKDPGAVYPEQAIRDHVAESVTVAVIVEVDRDGHVKSVRVAEPQGHGFDEAALEAARGLLFRPATKDGAPVPALTKHAYVFPPQPARLVGRVLAREGTPLAGATVTVRAADGTEQRATTSPDGRWTIEGVPAGTFHVTVAAIGYTPHESDETVGPAEEASTVDRLASVVTVDAGAEPEAEDVYVHGQAPPRDVTVRTLTQEELSRIPGTNGDALRGLMNLPGVGRPPGLAGILIVRGSAPQDTQTFVDGTAIPLIYHFGGLSSVVPTEMLDKIDFYPGNFSARYGRGMGGIVDVGLLEPKSDKIHGLVQADFIDGRAMVQGPIADGWSFSLAGRRSWLDVWLKPVLEQTGAGVSAAPVYYDYQALVAKTWDRKRQFFRAAFFGDDDRLSILVTDVNASDPALTGGISAHEGFWRGQLLYTNKMSDSLFFRANFAAGQDYFALVLGNVNVNVTEWPISSRIELAEKLTRDATNNVGLDLLYEPYTVFAQLPPPSPPGQPPAGPFLSTPPVATNESGSFSRPGFYDELELTPWRGGRIVPGVRLDYSSDTKNWDLAPRLLVRQDLTREFPRTTVKGAAGVYFQPPQPQETSPVFGQAGLVSNRATEFDVGLEQELTRYVDVNLDGFYKALDHLVVPGSLNSGTGTAFGLETLLKYHFDGRFFGWLAYTLSRSTRQDGPGLPTYLFTFDQTHILTAIASYRLGKGWQVGARFRFVSGNPYTPNAYGFFDENNATYLPLSQYPINGQRLPAFHQLDIRVDKTWLFSKWMLSAYLDVENVYNQGNVEGVSSNYNYTLTQYTTGIPFLPSFGLRGEF